MLPHLQEMNDSLYYIVVYHHYSQILLVCYSLNHSFTLYFNYVHTTCKIHSSQRLLTTFPYCSTLILKTHTPFIPSPSVLPANLPPAPAGGESAVVDGPEEAVEGGVGEEAGESVWPEEEEQDPCAAPKEENLTETHIEDEAEGSEW